MKLIVPLIRYAHFQHYKVFYAFPSKWNSSLFINIPPILLGRLKCPLQLLHYSFFKVLNSIYNRFLCKHFECPDVTITSMLIALSNLMHYIHKYSKSNFLKHFSIIYKSNTRFNFTSLKLVI